MGVKKRNIFFVVVFGMLCISLIGILFVDNLVKFISEDNNVKEIVTKKRETMIPYESDQYGSWELSLAWKETDDTNITLDADKLDAQAAFIDNNIENNALTLTTTINYTGGTTDDDFASEDLYFSFPLLPYATSLDSKKYVFSVDAENNRIKISNNDFASATIVGYINMGDLPYLDNLTDTDVFCWDLDTRAREIAILNNKDISASEDLSYTFDISYQLVPSEIVSGEENTIEAMLYFLEDEAYFNSLTFTVNTFVDLVDDSIKKTEANVKDLWDATWGTEPAGASDSFFALYAVDFNIAGNQRYTANLIPDFEDGKIVAVSDGTSYYSISGDIINNSTAMAPSNDYVSSLPSKIIDNLPGNLKVTRKYIVMYDRPDVGKSVTKDFTLDIEVTGGSDSSDVAQVTWSANYTNEGASVTPEYPTTDNNEVDQELIDETVGQAAINKLKNNENVFLKWKVESSSADINTLADGTTVKAFNNWNKTEVGTKDYSVEIVMDKLTLDSSYATVGDELVLTTGDYVIKSMYPEMDAEYDYILDINTRKYVLSEATIDTYTNKNVYVKSGTGSWTLIGTLKKQIDGTISYIAKDSATSSVTNVTSTNSIILPDNITNVKITYTGSRAAVYLGMNLDIELKSSDSVKNKINTLKNHKLENVVKNYTSSVINSSVVKTNSNGTYLTELELDSNLTYSSTVGTPTTDISGIKLNVIDYVIEENENIGYVASLETLAKSLLTEQKHGVFYILLPIGATLNGNVTATFYDGTTSATVISDTIENFNSTGRTLVKVDVKAPTGINNYYVGTDKLFSGFKINYSINYSQLSNRDYGNKIASDIAFFSDNEITNGYADSLDADLDLFSSDKIQNAFSKEDGSNNVDETLKNALYNTDTITIEAVTVKVGSVYKTVKTPLDADYTEATSVKEATTYRYKLQYVFTDPLTNINNLVLFDSLENSYGLNNYWQGDLVNVDTSYLKDTLGINAKVYYSTVSGINFEESIYTDLTKEAVWSIDKPTDLSTVTAIAVDCGDYEFNDTSKIPMIYIDMIASTNYNNSVNEAGVAYSAYNSGTVKFNNVGSDKDYIYSSTTTKVTLEKTPLQLELVAKDGINGLSFEPGTEDVPSRIDTKLGYLLTLKNTDTLSSYRNISLSDVIADGLIVDFDNISYYTTDVAQAKLISDDDLITQSYNGVDKNITLNISSIGANSAINIWIPVTVDVANLTTNNSLLVNMASIVKIENKAYRGNTLKIYNSIELASIEATKFVKTEDSEVFIETTTEAALINKGETYSYMVKVTNDGNIDTSAIKVVDNIADDLTVDETSISNGGVYDAITNTITWDITTLTVGTGLELTYNVEVATNISNNTRYSSVAHVTMVNPFDTTKFIFNQDTNKIITVYKTSTDLIITNAALGNLANLDKAFNYNVEFKGLEYAQGDYEVVNKDGVKIGSLTIDGTGVGIYSFTLKNDEKITFKDLAGEIEYKIIQTIELGYTPTLSSGVLINGENTVSITGVTSEERRVKYNFNNTYDAKTSFTPIVKSTYDKEMTEGMFEVTLKETTYDATYTETKTSALDGTISFEKINYDNVEGTYVYQFSQTEGTNERIMYDTNIYSIMVKVINDGKGTLNKEITYYDKYDKKLDITEIEFKNTFIPVGLLISNVFEGDYINPEKTFNYEIKVSADPTLAGTFEVFDTTGQKLDDFVIDDTGIGTYNATLKTDEYILISELPVGATYEVKQGLEDYYTSRIEGLPYTMNEAEKYISNNGEIIVSTIKVLYRNLYETKASFIPKVKVQLNDKELINEEFSFLLTDVSDGNTAGFGLVATNDVDGNIIFKDISYTKPGTYKYEIVQVKGVSNHIYYDLTKCLLTLVLTDNGDGTMSAESAYKYLNEGDRFINTYSEKPIVSDTVVVPDNGSNNGEINNPNTVDKKILLALIVGVLSTFFVIIHRLIKIKKFN